MINANLSQFLDTGWFNEATLYYNGYLYWCEGCLTQNKDHQIHFFVYKIKAHIVNGLYFKRDDSDTIGDYDYAFDIYGDSWDFIKEKFLKAKIFEGKSFWEVEKDLAWYDEL